MPASRKVSARSSSLLLFVGVSVVVHAGAVAVIGGGLSFELSVPKPDITWLDLDNRLGAPTPAPRVEPKAKPAAPSPPPPKLKLRKRKRPKKVAARKPRPRNKPDAGARPDAGPFTMSRVALGNLAPGDAALMLLLRMDRLRGSPYERDVRRLLEVFYDHKTLLFSSGLDPVHDFEAMLIATPNPYRVTRTFLAATHRLPARKLRRALNQAVRYKRGRMLWSRAPDGQLQGRIPSPPRLPSDPRVVLLRPNVVMLTDPTHLPLLTPRSPGSRRRPPDAGPAGLSWIQRLEQMEGMGGAGGEGPGMLLQAINLPRLVRLPPDFTTPLTLRVAIAATAPSEPEALLTFASEQDAKAFLAAIPRRVKQAKRSLVLRLLGVTDLLESIKYKQQGNVVEARVKLTGEQVKTLLEMFRNMIPQVRVPGMPETRIPDAGPPDMKRPDAGVPDQGTPDEAIVVPQWAR